MIQKLPYQNESNTEAVDHQVGHCDVNDLGVSVLL